MRTGATGLVVGGCEPRLSGLRFATFGNYSIELCKVSWARKDLVSSIIHNAERTAPQSSVLSVEINVKT
jgi:hypothetical protein